MTLWPLLPVDEQETHLSYAERLGLLHTGRGLERLLGDLGIRQEHFVSGHDEAIHCLAEATGQVFEKLRNMTVRGFQRYVTFRGEDVSKTFLSPRAARYCPLCLKEDGSDVERRHRLLWGFRLVLRCDLHALRLVEAPVKNATSLRVALKGAPLADPVQADTEMPEYLTWLRDRLNGECLGNDLWLEGQTIEQVLAASEMLGGVLEHGHRVSVSKLNSHELEQSTDLGFSIYRAGPEAITEALDWIRSKSPALAVQAGPLAYYGTLFDWLDRRCNIINPGPIRDILRAHIVKHSALGPREVVLGVEILERRFHNLQSLSAEVGIERLRLSRILRKMGEIPDSATEVEVGKLVFERARTVRLIESFKTAVPLLDVPAYISASGRQVETLYRMGILTPLVPSTSPGSVRQVVFAREHLDDFLERLRQLPDLPVPIPPEHHPLAYACQHGAGPFGELFAGVLLGKSGFWRHPEKAGISSIYVEMRTAGHTNVRV